MSPLDGSSNLQLVDLGTDADTSQAEVAVDIAAGFEHTCAVLQSGKVKCWGGNTSGQLGIGSTTNIGSSASQMGNALAAAQLGGAKAVSVSAGAGHTCVVLNDGGTRCWGDNFYGQLGQGVATEKIGAASSDMANLKNISLGTNASASGILASPGAFTCALLSSGGVKCFGHTGFNESSSNPFWGVLGTCWARPVYNSAAIPCWNSSSATPTNSLGYYSSDMGDNLPDLSLGAGSASQVAVGTNFGCALLSDKSIRCWGSNEHGQLGIGSNSNIGDAQNEMGANLKAAVSAAAGVEPVSVATGYTHTCAVFNNNTVKCWGASTENATGLAGKLSGDVGGTPTTTVDVLPVVYDGRI
jgi:alpha-tubulin suppressor-like RCC1 family protein